MLAKFDRGIVIKQNSKAASNILLLEKVSQVINVSNMGFSFNYLIVICIYVSFEKKFWVGCVTNWWWNFMYTTREAKFCMNCFFLFFLGCEVHLFSWYEAKLWCKTQCHYQVNRFIMFCPSCLMNAFQFQN